MNLLANRNGIALITALMLTMISLTMVMFLMYMVTMSTKMSGANRRYRTALDAAYGPTEMLAKDIIPAMFSNLSTPSQHATSLDATNKLNVSTSSDVCLREKLTRPSSVWSAACSKSYNPKENPDITLTLNSTTSEPFIVYSKIVETDCADKRSFSDGGRCTGSDLSGVDYLDNGAAVTGVGVIQVANRPALYRIEVRSERSNNAKEKANLSILYAY